MKQEGKKAVRQEKVGRQFQWGFASHSHPVSTGWKANKVMPPTVFNGFPLAGARKPLKRLEKFNVGVSPVTRLKPGVKEKLVSRPSRSHYLLFLGAPVRKGVETSAPGTFARSARPETSKQRRITHYHFCSTFERAKNVLKNDPGVAESAGFPNCKGR